MRRSLKTFDCKNLHRSLKINDYCFPMVIDFLIASKWGLRNNHDISEVINIDGESVTLSQPKRARQENDKYSVFNFNRPSQHGSMEFELDT